MMSRVQKKDKKVEVSFTNWMLGGSLLSVTSVDTETDKKTHPQRRISRKVYVADVGSVCFLFSYWRDISTWDNKEDVLMMWGLGR